MNLEIVDSPRDTEADEESDAVFEFKLNQLPENATISWFVFVFEIVLENKKEAFGFSH